MRTKAYARYDTCRLMCNRWREISHLLRPRRRGYDDDWKYCKICRIFLPYSDNKFFFKIPIVEDGYYTGEYHRPENNGFCPCCRKKVRHSSRRKSKYKQKKALVSLPVLTKERSLCLVKK